MARNGRVPLELRKRPFTLAEAKARGLTRRVLAGKTYRRLGRGLYCSADLEEEPWQLLRAWLALLPSDAVFIGFSAAWLHGLDVDPCHPIEVAVTPNAWSRSRKGLVVRHYAIPPGDVVLVRGLRATTVQRTLRALALRLTDLEALVLIDAALAAGLISDFAGRLGALAEPAESPMETRLRWLLLEAGLPRPKVQENLRDSEGRFVGRAGLYYPSARLVIEYDGANHRDRLTGDNRRQNLIQNAGYRILRFTAADIRQRPEVILAQVRQALARRALVRPALVPARGRASGKAHPAVAA